MQKEVSKMPTPKQSKIITVVCANVNGSDVIAFNRTTGEKLTAVAVSGKAVFDLNNLKSGWTVGDVIEIRVNGAYFGGTTTTLIAATGKQSTVTVTTTQNTTTNAPAINF